jgi:hypothetical protein
LEKKMSDSKWPLAIPAASQDEIRVMYSGMSTIGINAKGKDGQVCISVLTENVPRLIEMLQCAYEASGRGTQNA